LQCSRCFPEQYGPFCIGQMEKIPANQKVIKQTRADSKHIVSDNNGSSKQ